MKKIILKFFSISIFLIIPYLAFTQTEQVSYQGQQVAADRIIVQLNENNSISDAELTQWHLPEIKNVKAVSKTGPLKNFYLLNLKNKDNLASTLEKLNNNPKVKIAEPDYLVQADTTPNDTYFTNLWAMNNTGQAFYVVGTPDADIDAAEAWDVSHDCSSVVVGVIDSGIDYTHPDLINNMWQNPEEIASNSIDDDGNGYVDDVYGYDFVERDGDPMDENSHGTHVAGTIGASGNNNAGVVGVCWNIQLAALRFLDETGNGWNSDAILAINYAHNEGIKITNNSWGGSDYSVALYNAIAAVADEQVFIAAAGNDNTDNDVLPHYPSSYDLSNIISVTTTKSDDTQYYNYGATSVDLGAPGRYIYSTVPYSVSGAYYSTKSGTSMATPHVTGAAALLLANKSTLTVSEIKNILMTTGDSISSLAGKTVSSKRLNIHTALDNVVQTPIANVGGPYIGDEDIPITFNSSASFDPQNDPLSYIWNFGDSSSVITTTATTSHTYLDPGTYTLSLTVSDGTNVSSAVTTTVTVNNINDAPTANIGGPYSGIEDSAITLDASLSSDPDGTALTYVWDFGDSSTATTSTATTSHTYLDPGTYAVSLLVSDGVNNSSAVTTSVTIALNTAKQAVGVEVPETNDSQITITYDDNTTRSFSVFSDATIFAAALNSDNTKIVVINNSGKNIKVIDALTGDILDSIKINKKKQSLIKLKVYNYKSDSKNEIIIATLRKHKLKTTALTLTSAGKLKNKNYLSLENVTTTKLKISAKKKNISIKNNTVVLVQYWITAKALLNNI